MTREATTSRSEEAMTDRPSSLLWEEARDRETREEIYRFRYEQYFFRREYLPGTDHDGRRVWLPHDDVSRHFLLRTQEGRIVAVGTATPADAPAVCDEWRTMLELDALHDILGLTTIISRVIVAAEERNGPLFGQMCLRLASLLLEEGFRFAVHYCAPAVVSLYERLGYRIYGRGKNLESGAFRLPMMLVADDVEHLRRVRSPLRRAVGGGDAGRAALAVSLCPPLAVTPRCAMEKEKAFARLTGLCPALESWPPERVRHLLRGAVIPVGKGDLFAAEGVNEGSFLVLDGCMRQGRRRFTAGSILHSGGEAVFAEENSRLTGAPFAAGD